MKKITILSVFLLLTVFFGLPRWGAGAEYPRPAGYVNDFADVLSSDTEQKLEQKLREYEKQTSIEIAVATISSLEGSTVEDYANKLFRAWGVGKKDKDNGVLILVAPTEREMRIEVGYGLESELTDSQAGRIIRNDMIPYFKEGDMAQGIVAGVAKVIEDLGTMPIEERIREREEEARRAKESAAKFFRSFITVMAGIAIFTFLFIWVRRIREKTKQIREAHEKNKELFALCVSMHKKCVELYPVAKKQFELLKENNPKEVWAHMEESMRVFPEVAGRYTADHSDFEKILEKGMVHAIEFSPRFQNTHQQIEASYGFLESVGKKIEEIQNAKNIFQVENPKLPEEIERLRTVLMHRDVSSVTKKEIQSIEEKYAEAKKIGSGVNINWIAAAGLIGSVIALVRQTAGKANGEIEYAENARSEGPKLLREFPEKLKSAKSRLQDSDVSESTKKLAKTAEIKYQQAELKASVPDWIAAFALLANAYGLIEESLQRARNDIEEAESARRRRKRRSSSSHSSSSRSGSYGGGSRSSGGGGFGGGSSGGGGASGKW